MDEARLRELMADAPGEAPPPTFDIDEVRAASRRATLRRRAAVTGTSAVAVLALAGAGIFGTMAATGGPGQAGSGQAMASSSGESAGKQSARQENAAPVQPDTAGKRQPGTASEQDSPGLAPKQGGDGPGRDGPRADSTDGCDKVDRKLANALADELPATGTRPEPACSPDGQGVTFQLPSGVVTASVIAGTLPATYDGPPGTITVTRQTSGGGTLTLVSIPGEGASSAPLNGEVKRIATELAGTL